MQYIENSHEILSYINNIMNDINDKISVLVIT